MTKYLSNSFNYNMFKMTYQANWYGDSNYDVTRLLPSYLLD